MQLSTSLKSSESVEERLWCKNTQSSDEETLLPQTQPPERELQLSVSVQSIVTDDNSSASSEVIVPEDTHTDSEPPFIQHTLRLFQELLFVFRINENRTKEQS